MTLIIRARRTHIALSGGDRRDDPALLVPREKVAALIEALEAVTVEVPECSVCGEPATANILWHDDTTRSPVKRCHKHSMTVTPIETVTEVTI